MNAKSTITAIAMLVTIMVISSQPAQATFPGANGMIGYSHVNGPYEYGSEYHVMRAINPNGTGAHDILNHYYRFSWMGQWSPDGKKYLYEKGDVSPHEIWQANADGSSAKRVTTATCTVANPSWSPDGGRVLFQDCANGNVEIYIINTDGTNRIRLTNNAAWEGEASWSPNGEKIAYNRDGNVWIMDSNGANQMQITHDSTVAAEPDWSPDGMKIMYSCSDPGGVCIINSDGTNKTNINVDCGCSRPKWSPDGKKITFGGDKGYGGLSCGIYVMDRDGGNQVLISSKAQVDDRSGGWQPIPTANKTITLDDTGFTPADTNVAQGWKVRWNFLGTAPQAVVDDLSMGIFGSGKELNGGAYAATFYDAGSYPTFDPTTMKTGTINVLMKTSPATGPVGTTFTVTWSSRTAPAGKVFDVQKKLPDSTAWVYHLRGVKNKSATIAPTTAGTYSFRARLRGAGTVYWSPAGSFTVN